VTCPVFDKNLRNELKIYLKSSGVILAKQENSTLPFSNKMVKPWKKMINSQIEVYDFIMKINSHIPENKSPK
jgi:hypothetical protein